MVVGGIPNLGRSDQPMSGSQGLVTAHARTRSETFLSNYPHSPKERDMTGNARKPAKAKKAAKSARPAKAAHKKVSLARKVAPRKSAAKHTSKAKAPSGSKSDSDYTKFSGKFTVRLPKSLHQALVDRAEKEGVSLNLFVTNALSSKVAVSGGKKR